MRDEDLRKLKEPYKDFKIGIDCRFHNSIGADVPNANTLLREILNDLDANTFGIRWWTIPDQERILISDYLYQCAYGIETNLTEAKLHYLEWLNARDKENEKIADMVSINGIGEPNIKMPPSLAPIDDLPGKLEALNICGFFRAIGSSLDCLGATIIGVLGLKTKLRRSDIGTTENALKELIKAHNLGKSVPQLQIDFEQFYQNTKTASGANDWLVWTNQYRNMLVHRGRLIVQHQLIPRDHLFYDSNKKVILRTKSTTHLAKYPDRSDVENWIKEKIIVLNEDADITLQGIFQSCRDFENTICERLISIWHHRRKNPFLIEQPISQWDDNIKSCSFDGYDKKAAPIKSDLGLSNQVLIHRKTAAAVFDQLRHLWSNSKWI